MSAPVPSLPPPLERIPPTVAALADYEALARERLDAGAWAYLAGPAADGVAARRTRSAFDRLALWPRVLGSLGGGSTRVRLLGTVRPHPVLVAPVAFQTLFHPDGERATAMAAEALGAIMVASTMSGLTLEEIASGGPGERWFQLYWQGERTRSLALVRRAAAAGYAAIVLTVDAPVSGVRNAERRAGFVLPAHVRAANLVDEGPHGVPNGSGHAVFDGAMAAAPSWTDLAWLVEAARLPVLVKGVLHPADAVAAVEAGAAGVIVSNHGGRIFDAAPAPLEVLPAVARAVGGRAAVLLDGGILRGTDVLKAMALGADAVLVGRPLMHALAAAGALGVAHGLKLLVEELAVAMALCGLTRLDAAGPEILAPWPGKPGEDQGARA